MAVKSSFSNMVLCLLVICFVCSALLAGVNVLTKAPIEKAVAAKTENAVMDVAPECDIVSEVQSAEVDGTNYNYYVVRLGEAVTGYAIESATTGFGGTLKLMVGFDMNGLIVNTSVLECNETPGLGAKCKDALFSDQFKGFDPSVKALKVRKDGGDVDAITASTITSRAFSVAVENAVKVFNAIKPAESAEETEAADVAEVISEEGGADNE